MQHNSNEHVKVFPLNTENQQSACFTALCQSVQVSHIFSSILVSPFYVSSSQVEISNTTTSQYIRFSASSFSSRQHRGVSFQPGVRSQRSERVWGDLLLKQCLPKSRHETRSHQPKDNDRHWKYKDKDLKTETGRSPSQAMPSQVQTAQSSLIPFVGYMLYLLIQQPGQRKARYEYDLPHFPFFKT